MLLVGAAAWARGVYQEPELFVAEAFDGQPPRPSVLWLPPALQEATADILGHPPGFLRLRYWRRNERTAWVLDEIGKEEPITTGIVVEDGRIRRLRILVFRESRGWEVRHDFFTRQFDSAALDGEGDLDRGIDGISGATLSVRAVTRLARVALTFHEHVMADDTG